MFKHVFGIRLGYTLDGGDLALRCHLQLSDTAEMRKKLFRLFGTYSLYCFE